MAAEAADLAEAAAIRGGAADLDIVASESFLRSASLEVELERLAARSGATLAVDEGGHFVISGSRLGITSDGVLTATGAQGSARLLGQIIDGHLWKFEMGRPTIALGTLRATSIMENVALRAAPVNDAVVLRTLRTGLQVDVYRMRSGWFDVVLRDGQRGWVPGPALQLVPTAIPLVTSGSARWIAARRCDQSPIDVVLRDFDALARRYFELDIRQNPHSPANEMVPCRGDDPRRDIGLRNEYINPGLRFGGRAATLIWQDTSVAVVNLRMNLLTYAWTPYEMECEHEFMKKVGNEWRIVYRDFKYACP